MDVKRCAVNNIVKLNCINKFPEARSRSSFCFSIYPPGRKTILKTIRFTVMKRNEVKDLIEQGYHVLQRGGPVKVKGDLWYYLEEIDEEDTGVLVLADMLHFSDEELERVRG